MIVDGLTGFYDENAYCLMAGGFPLEKLFGGTLKEVQTVQDRFQIGPLFEMAADKGRDAETGIADAADLSLPGYLWRGTIHLTTGQAVATAGGEVLAARNRFGQGEVIWIPSLVGLACRIDRDYRPVAAFLGREVKGEAQWPFYFARLQPGMLMKTLRSGDSYLTVIVNQSQRPGKALLKGTGVALVPSVLFADKGGGVSNRVVDIGPAGTLVIRWQ